jgi:hypothetical protein
MAKKLRGWHLGLAAVICIVSTSRSWADDLSTEPFEVRLWLAMSRAISSTDAIGREASVAYRSASSDNPAAVDVRRVEPVSARGFFCAGTHHIMFADGAWIAAEDVNGFIRFNTAGTISMGYIHIALPEGQTRQGFEDDLGSHEFIFKYGRQIHPKMYVGAGIRVSDMNLDYGDLFQGAPRNTHDHSISGSFTLGSLWQPKPNWTIGVLAGAGWIGSDIEGVVHLPGFMGTLAGAGGIGSDNGGAVYLPGIFGPINVPFQFDLTTRTVNVKTGFGWRATPVLTVYSDVQYFRLDNSMSSEEVGRFYFGGDVHVSRSVTLMAGGSVDTNLHASVSSGIGINLMKPGRLKPTLLKLSYQYNPLPEIQQEFGKGNLVSATMVFSF